MLLKNIFEIKIFVRNGKKYFVRRKIWFDELGVNKDVCFNIDVSLLYYWKNEHYI